MIGGKLSHYIITERIGAGGMGVVYRARDEHLERDVALKVLPSGLLADEDARRRFRNEALALARLNHPNVATVHEFAADRDVDFLITEYIPGVTLDEKLSAGSLSPKETVRLGIQFLQGLAAAHDQGIVHRDLKPSNLRLTPDGRLKILDFGLAQLMRPSADLATTLTQSHHVTGTLPYMAPELLRGAPTDPRCDIYAAGAVLYEMATGVRAFPETDGPQLITAILHKELSAPALRDAVLSPSFGAVVLKALDKDPARRYQSAHEFRIDLERLNSAAVPLPPSRKTHRLAWSVAAAGTLLLLAVLLNVAGVRNRIFNRGAETSGVASARARRSVAVLGFKNASGKPEEAWISTALGEMLTTELAAGGQLRAIPGENVARMKLDLSLPDAGSYGRDTLRRIHKRIGSDFIVLGSYVALGNSGGGKVRLDLQLQDASAGETLAVVSEEGTEAELLDLVSRAGASLRQKLGVASVSQAEASGVRASLPSNPEAARLYAEGLAKLRLFDAMAARDLLQQAVAADSGFALAHAALSDSWFRLGYDVKARDEARSAFDLAQGLSQEDRLSVEARYRQATGDWDRAVELSQSLWNFFPDNIEYGLRLASSQVSAGKPKDALETVERLRGTPAPERDDARIDLVENTAAEALGDFKLAQAAAARAAEKSLVVGARLLRAEARGREGWASERLGQPDRADAAFLESYKLYSESGDRHGAAHSLQLLGDALYDRGDYAGARQNYEQALAVYRQLGAQRSIATALNALGNVETDLGQLDAARRHYEQTLAVGREIGAKGAVAGALGNIASVLDSMGQLEEARKRQEECLQAFREIGNQRGESSTLSNLANLLVELGELDAAQQRYAESLKIVEQTGYRRGRGFALQGLADVLLFKDQVDAAGKTSEEAQSIRRDLKEENNLALTNTQLAQIRLEQGRNDEAEVLLRSAVDTFDRTKQVEFGAQAYAMLTRNFLAQGKLNEARSAAQRALALSRQSGYRPPRFDAAIASARVQAAAGDPRPALRDLHALLAETTQFGYLPYQFEVRLAIAEIEMHSGNLPAARPHLDALEKDARSKGFLLVARKAAALNPSRS